MSKAILHDQINTNGGAERVAFAMARAFDCPIYAMWVDESKVPEDIEAIELSGRIGDRIGGLHYHIEDLYQMLQWQHVDCLYQYDTIIQNKTNPYWFVPHADSQTVIRYLHSTPRNLYDQHKRRGGNVLHDALATVQRLLYEPTTDYADQYICNSEIVQRRLSMYWDQDAQVVYPPVDTSYAEPRTEPADYLFHVGRLALNKRIPLLKEIAYRTNKEVIVAGDGDCKKTLLDDKPENLTYLGYVDEQTKWAYLNRAKATLFLAENEDFGIVPVESFAAGTPVIGVEEGYTKYQIKTGKNGYTIFPNATDALHAIDAVYEQGVSWTAEDMAQYAKQFNAERFKSEIQRVVEQAEEDATIEANHKTPAKIHE